MINLGVLWDLQKVQLSFTVISGTTYAYLNEIQAVGIKVRRNCCLVTLVHYSPYRHKTTLSMPRPRVHHTPEEKKAANRAKSNRHYAK